MKKQTKIKFFFMIVYSIIVILFLWVFFTKFSINELTSFDFIKNNRDYLIKIREKNFFLISIIFYILTIVWVLLLGFGSPIILLGGFIFGKWFGTIISVIGLTTGATLLYIFANYFLKDLVKNKFSTKFVSLHDKFKKNEFIYFIIYRFVGGIPFAISNIIPTIFNVKVKNFFFGTLIGMMPQVFIGVTLGSGLEKIVNENKVAPSFLEIVMNPAVYYPIIALVVLLIASLMFRKIFYKK
tara:strand:- start:1403 stop:2122 length:720 start_codon:yes stop_codon:yes gene_type:complete